MNYILNIINYIFQTVLSAFRQHPAIRRSRAVGSSAAAGFGHGGKSHLCLGTARFSMDVLKDGCWKPWVNLKEMKMGMRWKNNKNYTTKTGFEKRRCNQWESTPMFKKFTLPLGCAYSRNDPQPDPIVEKLPHLAY